MCGETSADGAGPLGCRAQDRPGALAGQPAAAGVAGRPPGCADRRPGRAGAHEVAVQRLAGLAPHRDEPLLAALAAQQRDRARPARGRRRRGPTASLIRAPVAVQELQQRPVAQPQRLGGHASACWSGSPRPPRHGQRLGQPLGGGRRLHLPPGSEALRPSARRSGGSRAPPRACAPRWPRPAADAPASPARSHARKSPRSDSVTSSTVGDPARAHRTRW